MKNFVQTDSSSWRIPTSGNDGVLRRFVASAQAFAVARANANINKTKTDSQDSGSGRRAMKQLIALAESEKPLLLLSSACLFAAAIFEVFSNTDYISHITPTS